VVALQMLGVPSHFQPISILHVAEQPSPGTSLRSSHCSGNESSPSPHFAKGRHGVPGSRQSQPGSTKRQLAAHPSPSFVPPSSQASVLASRPSPHIPTVG